MDMDMSIAAMSVNMHQNQVSNDLGVSVLKMAMDSADDASQLVDELASLDPNLGTNIDIQA